MKRIIAMTCIMVLVLTGCGGSNDSNREATATPAQGKQYVAADTALLPDESMYEGDLLLTTELQTNWQGEPALYQLRAEVDDDGEEYAALVEYSLNSEGNWQTKEFCKKELLKQFREETEHNMDFPFVQRGDDGNLYVLVKRSDDDELAFGGPMGQAAEEKPYCSYSVLAIDEGNDTFHEVTLQTKTTTEEGEEIDYAREYDVTAFHVMEDGTVFLVFSGASAMWFDGETGIQTNFCPTIADSAFGKKVAFGESQMLYYSTASKLFGILDSDTLTVSLHFGEEISEEDRKYEWYFDTDTTTWQTYAFNQSGLYRISDFGKKASAIMLSSTGNFDHLADANIYDILVGANEELYVLVRRPAEDSTDYGETWEFAVIRYQPR